MSIKNGMCLHSILVINYEFLSIIFSTASAICSHASKHCSKQLSICVQIKMSIGLFALYYSLIYFEYKESPSSSMWFISMIFSSILEFFLKFLNSIIKAFTDLQQS